MIRKRILERIRQREQAAWIEIMYAFPLGSGKTGKFGIRAQPVGGDSYWLATGCNTLWGVVLKAWRRPLDKEHSIRLPSWGSILEEKVT